MGSLILRGGVENCIDLEVNYRFTRLKKGRKEGLGIKIKEWSWAGRD